MQHESEASATPCARGNDEQHEDAQAGAAGAHGNASVAMRDAEEQARSAVICVCLVSMMEDSIVFQTTVCREYCMRHGLAVVAILQNQGKVGLATLNWQEWKIIVSASVPSHVVFYRLRHISVAARELHDAVGIPNVALHFVQDGLVYDTARRAPSFRLAPLTMSSETRNKLRDLITLMHMPTCAPRVMHAFVVENFGGFDDLVCMLRSNVVLVTLELNRFRLRRVSTLHRGNRRSMMRWPLHFGDFLKQVRKLRAMFDSGVRAICESMETVTLADNASASGS